MKWSAAERISCVEIASVCDIAERELTIACRDRIVDLAQGWLPFHCDGARVHFRRPTDRRSAAGKGRRRGGPQRQCSPPDATAVDWNSALDGQLQRLVGRLYRTRPLEKPTRPASTSSAVLGSGTKVRSSIASYSVSVWKATALKNCPGATVMRFAGAVVKLSRACTKPTTENSNGLPVGLRAINLTVSAAPSGAARSVLTETELTGSENEISRSFVPTQHPVAPATLGWDVAPTAAISN